MLMDVFLLYSFLFRGKESLKEYSDIKTITLKIPRAEIILNKKSVHAYNSTKLTDDESCQKTKLVNSSVWRS